MEDEKCSICFEKLGDEKTEDYTLSCNHIYHKLCISQWLNNHTTCPLCRADVDPIEQYVDDDIVSPDRMDIIREQVSNMRMIAHFGAYGLEGLGSLFSGNSKGLAEHLGRCVNCGMLDEGFTRIARKEEGGLWLITMTVIIAIFTHYATV